MYIYTTVYNYTTLNKLYEPMYKTVTKYHSFGHN